MEDVADVQDDQVDRDNRQELREHLDQEQRQHPEPSSAEAEPAERVRRERAEENGQERGRAGDDHRIRKPARVVRVLEGRVTRRVLLAHEERAKVVEGHMPRNQRRAAQ